MPTDFTAMKNRMAGVRILTSEQLHNYTELLRSRLSGHRFHHSLCVAEEAVRLAKLYGADEQKAELAGLLHDIMKEADREEQERYIRMDSRRWSEYYDLSPKLMHAPAAVAYLRRELGIKNREVLGAIRYHTTGRAGMTLLEKVIFLADFTSADRDYHEVDKMRSLVNKSMEKAMMFALSFTITDLVSKDRPVHPDTFAAYNDLFLSGGR